MKGFRRLIQKRKKKKKDFLPEKIFLGLVQGQQRTWDDGRRFLEAEVQQNRHAINTCRGSTLAGDQHQYAIITGRGPTHARDKDR